MPASRPPRWRPDRRVLDAEALAQLERLREVARGDLDLVPVRAHRLDQRPHHEHVRAVGQIDPDAHERPATLLRSHAVLASITDPIVERGRGRRGCDGAAGSVPADGPGERLHPGAQRGHDAVRRLQRLARRVQPVRRRRRSARSPTSSAPGSPTGSATPAASTSSRSTARSCTSRRATSSGPTAGSSATATPPSSSRACCRSSAPSSRCPRAWRACRSGASRVLTLAGLHPVGADADLHRQAGRRQLGGAGRTTSTTSTTPWPR